MSREGRSSVWTMRRLLLLDFVSNGRLESPSAHLLSDAVSILYVIISAKSFKCFLSLFSQSTYSSEKHIVGVGSDQSECICHEFFAEKTCWNTWYIERFSEIESSGSWSEIARFARAAPTACTTHRDGRKRRENRRTASKSSTRADSISSIARRRWRKSIKWHKIGTDCCRDPAKNYCYPDPAKIDCCRDPTKTDHWVQARRKRDRSFWRGEKWLKSETSVYGQSLVCIHSIGRTRRRVLNTTATRDRGCHDRSQIERVAEAKRYSERTILRWLLSCGGHQSRFSGFAGACGILGFRQHRWGQIRRIARTERWIEKYQTLHVPHLPRRRWSRNAESRWFVRLEASWESFVHRSQC